MKTVRLAAPYADACNLFDVPGRTDLLKRTLDVLAAHCLSVGRPVGEIEKTASSRLGNNETPAPLAARRACAVFADWDSTISS